MATAAQLRKKKPPKPSLATSLDNHHNFGALRSGGPFFSPFAFVFDSRGIIMGVEFCVLIFPRFVRICFPVSSVLRLAQGLPVSASVSALRSQFRDLPVFGRYFRLTSRLLATLPKPTFVTHLESALPQNGGRGVPPKYSTACYNQSRQAPVSRGNSRDAHL